MSTLNDSRNFDNSNESYLNCTNDYCASDSDYRDMIVDYIKPVFYEWILIGMHILVFVIGIIGNILVCLAVYRNRSMRTVVNYFLVNLAFADFLVLIICLPPTVLWDITETWFLGSLMCKTILYLQNVSVTVSILTLTFISIDRWYAICHPLRFRSSTKKALNSILIIWIIALIFALPELVYLDTKRKLLNINIVYFTQCEPTWSKNFDTMWMILKMICLYFLPLVLMTIAYVKIIRNLWRPTDIILSSDQDCKSSKCNSSDVRIRSRRKAAKMLVCIVIMFSICYFPVHLLSLVRLIKRLPQNDFYTTVALISHWLCYANSAINPLIYNFMNSKYRNEFSAVFRSTYRNCYHDQTSNDNIRKSTLTSSARRQTYGSNRTSQLTCTTESIRLKNLQHHKHFKSNEEFC